MKWKRIKPGRYTSGLWEITQVNGAWILTHDGDRVGEYPSKAAAQRQVEAGSGSLPDAPLPTGSVESALLSEMKSLRLEISHLATQIANLTATLNARTTTFGGGQQWEPSSK